MDDETDEEQPRRKKKVLKKHKTKTESTHESDSATEAENDNDVVQKPKPVQTYVVYDRNQVKTSAQLKLLLGNPADYFKVTLADIDGLKCSGSLSPPPKLQDRPLSAQGRVTSEESGSDIADLSEDIHKLLFLDREEDLL